MAIAFFPLWRDNVPRKSKLKYRIAAALSFLALFILSIPAHAQSPTVVAAPSAVLRHSERKSNRQDDSPGQVLAARINRERLARGLVPYALNAQLTAAAQAHADDLARTGNYSHTGSDGSTVFERVAHTGYGAYSWGRRLGENWAWYRDAATALAMWMDSAPHRDNILHPLYREFGIGIAPGKNGNSIFVVVFGAQPNLLPIFINDLATETRTRAVTLTLSSEDVMPNGDGAGTIGRAVEAQISNRADFAGAPWQPFATRLPWTLTEGGGTKTVYVKFRDTRGRTATSWTSIRYVASGNNSSRASRDDARLPASQPTAAATRTLRPSPTVTRMLSDSRSMSDSRSTPTTTEEPTQMPTPTATVVATEIIAIETPTALPTLVAASQATRVPDNPEPFALGVLGIVIVLSVLVVACVARH